MMANKSIIANAQFGGVPIESFPGYFTYFDPAAANNPPGSDTANKAILYYKDLRSSGTMSLIYTDRNDDTICACMAGHQIRSFFPAGVVSLGPFASTIDVYSDYMGRDSVATINGVTYHLNKNTGNYSKSVLTGGNLVAYYYNQAQATAPDIALVLIDGRQLLNRKIGKLGYDLDKFNWGTSEYYSISYPHNYPQRLQDEYEITVNGTDLAWVLTSLPFAAAPGSSGAPLIKRPGSPSEPWYMRGVMSTANYVAGEVVYDRFLNDNFEFSYEQGFTKIGVIAEEIKRHCWKNRDSSYIIANGLNKKPTLVDNSINLAQFTTKRSITSASGIPGVASFSGPLKKRIMASYIPGGEVELSGFTMPSIYPGDAADWLLVLAGKEINVLPEFSYTATGLSELTLGTVVGGVGSLAGSARISDSIETPQPAAFNGKEINRQFSIYPNPSPEGAFHISLPLEGHYRVEVIGMDGKTVFHSGCDTNPFVVKMPAISKGTFLLNVYATGEHTPVYSQLVIY
ncbi:hypothetical protein DN068_20560 [Taibaiella soli]|uniref:Uncharacterized protein n=2 Tax=Taibaiella soli TaxID=1649169 RepID=A0A2W2BTI1_9BACT|nr:hypothetical protein DN068_20560 [Taibaiella soli]